jgi:single-strand DNA-binding protein
MINQVTLVGRLGGDPDIKESKLGSKFAKLNIATNKKYKVGDEWQERTQWHNVVVFQPTLATFIENYAKKGATVFVQGTLEYRSYDSGETKKFITEIVVTGFDGIFRLIKNANGTSSSPIADEMKKIKADEQSPKEKEIDKADIPF